MSIERDQILEYVQNLRLRDLRTLVSSLEERLGVSATPVVTPRPLPPPVPPPQPTSFDVVLTSVGDHRLAVIRALRAQLGCSLADARSWVVELPSTVAEALDPDTAEALRQGLCEAGATAECRSG